MKSSTIKELDTQIAAAEKRKAELDAIRKQVEEFERKKNLLEQQIQLIDRLKLQQADAVHMLDEISKALPDFVWLDNVTQAGNNLRFQGRSNGIPAIANFIENLEKSGWFGKQVNLVSSTEQNNVYTFQLTANFANPEVAKRAAEAAAARPPAPPAQGRR
jgi:type IV pilus assembly protein PilN